MPRQTKSMQRRSERYAGTLTDTAKKLLLEEIKPVLAKGHVGRSLSLVLRHASTMLLVEARARWRAEDKLAALTRRVTKLEAASK